MKRLLNKRFTYLITDSKSSRNPFGELFMRCAGYLAGLLFLIYVFYANTTILPAPVHPVTPTPSAVPTVQKIRQDHTPRRWSGIASYYSRDGCLGCSKTFTMANGQTLDDSRLTLAMTPTDVRTHTLLNKHVIVKNIKTNAHVVATVTDTGGFARHNRIADLSVATKQAIGCSDLCEVEITVE